MKQSDSIFHQVEEGIAPKDVMTALPNGGRVAKDDLRMEACGSIDELNSFIGLLLTEVPTAFHEELHAIQRRLFAVGAFAVGVAQPEGMPGEEQVAVLRTKIKEMQMKTGPLHSFVLPGGCRSAALAHVCRTVCRRAERNVVALEAYAVVPYMNRLSTYFFYLALLLNYFHRSEEIKL